MAGGLVARPGMALLPCHQWSGGCCRPVERHALTADRDTAQRVLGLFVTWVPAPGVKTATSNDAPRKDSIMDTRFAVVIGLDVGKTAHHACALDPDGNKLFDKPLPQDETKLRELFTQLQNHGEVLMVVD